MTTDVNQAFAAERASQIAGATATRDRAVAGQAAAAARFDARLKDGKLRDLGNGRFRVTDPGSWDDGEVLSMQAPRLGEIPLILPEHGLEETDGKASVYAAVPMWHQLGTVIPGGTSSVDQVIDLSGLGFEVEQRPVHYLWDGELHEAPGKFVNVRTDTGAPLGVVGKVYTTVQPREGFAFLQAIVDSGDVIFESAGVLRGGAKTFISVRLPEGVTIDAGGINDKIIPFVSLMDDHSGNGQFQAVASPWRPICGNTNRFALRDAITRWGVRHTRSIPERVKEARRTLGLSVAAYAAFADEETQLARIDIQLKQFETLVAGVWTPTGEEATSRAKTLEANRNDALVELFATESGRVGRTAYAAEQAITGYWDNVVARRAGGQGSAVARATAVLEGANDPGKAKVHARLMTLTNR